MQTHCHAVDASHRACADTKRNQRNAHSGLYRAGRASGPFLESAGAWSVERGGDGERVITVAFDQIDDLVADIAVIF